MGLAFWFAIGQQIRSHCNVFTVKALSSGTEIFIYGDIGSDWASESVSAKDFVKQLQEIDAAAITVRINSVGGSVPDGLAIYNALKRHPATVTTSIDGMAFSIASMIAMAGDTVQMADNAMFMVHAPWAVVAGNAEGLRESADTLDRWADSMATSYAAKTGKGVDHAKAFLDGEDHFFSAEEALAEGFIDQVSESVAIAAYGRIPQDSLSRFINPGNLSQTQREEFTMPDPVKKPDAAAAAKAEATRCADIQAKFESFMARAGVPSLMSECIDDKSITADAAADKLLAKLGEGAEPAAGHIYGVPDNMKFGPSGSDRFREDATAAILTRAGLADKETRLKAVKTSFQSFSLLDFAKASLQQAGVNPGMMDPMRVVGAAFTQTASDFPVLLENTMHKALLDAYSTAPDTWTHFCLAGSVSDFRAHGRYRTGTIGIYDTVNEAGEYVNKVIPDGEKATIQVDTRGNIINLTRKAIINDDMGSFLGLAADLGRAGKRTIEAAVYSLLAENSNLGPTMLDGDPLFDANHSNLGTGAVLSMASIDADRVVMASQPDVSGNDFLYLRPKVWLGPMASGGTARSVNQSQYDPDAANKLQKPNIVNGLFDEVIDTPRLAGTRYYLFADPMQAPVIEVAFLNGIQEPYIEMQDGFSVDGTRYKARLDFGVAAIDYRGAVTNAGTT